MLIDYWSLEYLTGPLEPRGSQLGTRRRGWNSHPVLRERVSVQFILQGRVNSSFRREILDLIVYGRSESLLTPIVFRGYSTPAFQGN